MLHSVVPDASRFLYHGNYLTLERLDTFLAIVKRRRYPILNMDDVRTAVVDGSDRFFVAFTFDDGYRDNLIHALPVFEKYGFPFCVYVITDMVERKLKYWWRDLIELIIAMDSIDFAPLNCRFDCESLEEKVATLNKVLPWAMTDLAQATELINDMCASAGINQQALLEEDGLSHDEVRALAEHPLGTIGGHTTTHSSLADLSGDEVEAEMVENKAYLESLIQTPVSHFAYPYGCYGKREVEIAASVGYETAVTCEANQLSGDGSDDPMRLPRCALNCHTRLSTFVCTLDGITPSAIRNVIARIKSQTSTKA